MTSIPYSFKHILIILLIFSAAIVVYWNVGGYEFTNFDDNQYVSKNRYVQNGINKVNIGWAFSLSKTADTWTYWHPLTSLSHMLDVELFGLDAGKHHLVNLFIHIINATLLYLVFYQMTGAAWRSAFVALLFTVHPLNVDSVAWIAERKNLLSTTFWMLSMLTYVHYARKPSAIRYILVFITMAVGLLAKPMLVTLPCVLLLMDFWPLGRLRPPFILTNEINDNSPFQSASLTRLISEKLPLLVISSLSIIASMISLKFQNSIITHVASPMLLRLENAVVSYVKYIGKILWPHDMAIYYPFPKAIPAWQTISALIFLVSLTAVIVLIIRKAPFLSVGWFWFIGTLTPVIGIIQGGLWPEIADRWTYVPAIGLFIIAAWGGAAIVKKYHIPKIITAIPVVLSIALLMFIARGQTAVWQNSITLFSHALAVAPENEVAHFNLGKALSQKKELNEALRHYLIAIELNPNVAQAHNNLGNLFAEKKQIEKAVRSYQNALLANPDLVEAHLNLAKFLKEKNMDKALFHYQTALEINPNRPDTHIGFGKLLTSQKSFDKAILHFQKAITLQPGSADAFNSLGNALGKKGETDKALNAFHQALAIDPTFMEAYNNLGNALIKNGRLDEALYYYEKAISNDIANKDSLIVKNKGILLSLLTADQQVQIIFKTAVRFADDKNFDKAVELFQRIIDLDPDNTVIYFNISCLYARQNQKTEAIDWLRQAVEKGYANWEGLKNDPDMKNIIDEPYVQELIE